MKTTFAQKLKAMSDYLTTNAEITLRSGRVISAIELAIVRIYQNQTPDECAIDETLHSNNRGFASCDARWGSYIARRIMGGYRLHPNLIERGLRLAIKYRRQLVALAEKKKVKVAE